MGHEDGLDSIWGEKGEKSNTTAENEEDDEEGIGVENVLGDNRIEVEIVGSVKEFLKHDNVDIDVEQIASIETNTNFIQSMSEMFPLGSENPHEQLKLGNREENNFEEDGMTSLKDCVTRMEGRTEIYTSRICLDADVISSDYPGMQIKR